ncbi:MAG: outer membrane beta-barrel protein [Ignavibacteriae bacterium]|nr:outer membrane beta-barrel protein [Ignavibacteriota bacterium]
MKKVTLVLLTVVFAASLGFAGEPKTKMGDEALLFSFSGLANLAVGNYGNQYGIGAKYYFQDDMAFRGSLGFNLSTTTKKDPTTQNRPDDKTTEMSFSIMPGIQYNMATNGSVVAYVGAQASFSAWNKTQDNAGFANGQKDVSSTTSFGVGGFAGFEWFAWDNISLGGEYNLMLNIGSGSDENTPAGGTAVKTDRPSTMGFGFGSSGALTAAVYF